MKKTFWISSLILLIFTAVSALFGGFVLIKDPSGGIMHMPVEAMKYSPFSDFLIPGIILFVFNGLFSLVIFILTLAKYKHYQLLVVFQGSTLLIWIVVQMIMLQSFNYFHAIYGGTGIVLILTGLLLYSRK